MTEPIDLPVEVNKEESPVNEIITKEPERLVGPPKMKDPKKIEAGKKLAAYNKKAKNSKKELKENGQGVVVEETKPDGSDFNITLTTVVAIIGLGLTGVDLYFRHKKYNQKGVEDFKATTIDYKPMDNKEVENEKNKKKGVKRVRFEPGME